MDHLDCPICGEEVFDRADGLFLDGDREDCGECGTPLRIVADDSAAYAEIDD